MKTKNKLCKHCKEYKKMWLKEKIDRKKFEDKVKEFFEWIYYNVLNKE